MSPRLRQVYLFSERLLLPCVRCTCNRLSAKGVIVSRHQFDCALMLALPRGAAGVLK